MRRRGYLSNLNLVTTHSTREVTRVDKIHTYTFGLHGIGAEGPGSLREEV